MADKKITALTAETDIDSDDLAHIVTDVSTSATNKKITIANVFNKIPTTIGYGTDAVSSVTVSTSIFPDVSDGKAYYSFVLEQVDAACVATMSDGDHVGQTITIALVATLSFLKLHLPTF